MQQVDFGAGLESVHLSSHSHYDHTQANNAGFNTFRHPGVSAIDPNLEQTPTPHRNGHAPMSSVHQAPNHLLQPDNAALSTNMAHQFYGDIPRTSQTPSTPSNASPRFSAVTPTSQPKQIAATYVPSDREPPSRHQTDATLDDAYANFILYCNPNFSTDTDTSELKRLFRSPPKSDKKESFSTWKLFELIGKLESKEIATWTRLALDLGVEPPDMEKGQSTQKVQQYSVRLKRWMRAMHIDAFFEYLLGKQHPYYLQIPPPHDPFPENGRDGVPLEEDLAIRALDPKFRPKRGRKKAEDPEDGTNNADGTPPRKRPQLDTSVPFGNALQPQSAYPASAHPDHMEGFLSAHDHWPASSITPASAMTSGSTPNRLNPNKNLTPYSASPMSGQHMRWRMSTETPATPHPLSAVTPLSAHPDYFDEPQSAVTPSSSKPRSRRRHGPAVSSAWPSNNSSSTGKLRGRPPTNRSVRDGPFVTFPANPKTKEGPLIDMSRGQGNLTPIVERAHSDPPLPDQHFRFPPTPASAISPTTMDGSLQNSAQKPHRLSLQVPQNFGNPVRLVTPTVLVNGEQDNVPNATMVPPGLDHAMLSFAISSCLGMCAAVGLGAGGPTGGVRRIECVRFRVGGDGYESPVDDDEDEETEGLEGAHIKESFDVHFGVSFGPMTGEWSVKGISPVAADNEDDENKKNGEKADSDEAQNTIPYWRSKFLEAQRKLWDNEESTRALREKVLDAVL
ncbi:hypothetical protein M011DRAFT_408236 [Sporormia fimetaria CBS 119925]|uniref:ARS binding protein Abp2 n=1 Tax=Sporormia fimetaria CBS 119925 TaxID=1340428 RepID=A0A6A6V5J9_9PLEO|nr:hypothetical protein M011DRAFT_408236 [Sporormia fimetaria CBS 119925]